MTFWRGWRAVAAVLVVVALATGAWLVAHRDSGPSAARGGSSPSDVAIRYMVATIHRDQPARERLRATRRTGCPRLGPDIAEGFVIPQPGERLAADVRRVGAVWQVTPGPADRRGHVSHSVQPLTVVRYGERYWVC